MEMDTFDNIGPLNLSGDNTIINISHEYILGETEDDDNNIYREINLKDKTKVISSIPYLWFVLILTIFLFIVTLIIYLIVISTYNENYTIENNIYLKPKISGHNYSSILFDNGMKIILTQVHFNDTSGGAISFDSGYLDKLDELQEEVKKSSPYKDIVAKIPTRTGYHFLVEPFDSREFKKKYPNADIKRESSSTLVYCNL